jgi:hypothetical protein
MDQQFTLQQQGRQARQAGAQMLHTDECIRQNQSVLRRRGTGSRAGSLLPRADVYIQIPDSDPAGVVSTARDFMENFGVSAPLPHDLRSLAVRIGELCAEGWIVVLDEFQYFSRKARFPFTSELQSELDRLAATPGIGSQVAGYLKTSEEKYELVEKRLPLFAKPKARKGHYTIRDNFLRCWLDALAVPTAAINFRPLQGLVEQADQRLMTAEGYGLERLVGQLYEERSRLGLRDFPLTSRIEGWWDRSDTEIDLVALDETAQRLRLGS